jgi:hypothetical protein
LVPASFGLHGLEIRFPQVEAERVVLAIPGRAPHLRRIEANVVDGLGVLALLLGVGVGEDERVVEALDDTLLAA